jgi:phage repressor protein C with HTH and peptisase S24 domain
MVRGDRIEELLKAKGWSQAELARRIGVQSTTIWKLVSGEGQGSKHLHKIARELETTPEYLTGETDNPAPPRDFLARRVREGVPDNPGLADRRLGFRGKEPEHDPDLVEIAEIDLRFGLGAAFMDQEIVEQQAELRPFPKAWLRHITSAPADQLYWAKGQGDSMEPKISEGEVILIDRSQTDAGFGDLYWAIAYGQTAMVKRLRPMPDGSIKILSDNPNVPPETAYDGELHIFGRVIAVVKLL